MVNFFIIQIIHEINYLFHERLYYTPKAITYIKDNLIKVFYTFAHLLIYK